MHQWQKCGKNPSIDTGDITETFLDARIDWRMDRGEQNSGGLENNGD